jgi:cobyrinic acid a,c-diamide synthase
LKPIPRLVIGGAHSGVGKSSVALALVAALRKRGLKVQTFKVGPDYLDPSHLTRLSGRPCYNLDGWMSDEIYVRQLFHDACADADIAIIEGVMGLFDGSNSNSLDGSTAQIASWLQGQVLLVVNAHGMARSIAALVQGYAEFDPTVQVGGVIANMCGSVSHGELLRQALDGAQLPPLFGAIHRDDFPALPSRHLGLVSADEFGWDTELCRRLREVAEDRIDIDRLLTPVVATEGPVGYPSAGQNVANIAGEKLRIGIARDTAFQFYYPDLFDELKKRSVELCFFSPLCDSCVPQGCDALYLGGGYPEVHADILSENKRMLRSVAEFCHSGKPVYAECGGLIYLSHGVEIDGRRWPLVGILPSWAQMLEKRKALGYVEATLQRPALFGGCEIRLRGHEFHYSELSSDPIGIDGWQSAYQLKQNRSGICRDEGYQKGQILASYAHLHLASQPQALDAFIERIRRVKTEQGITL